MKRFAQAVVSLVVIGLVVIAIGLLSPRPVGAANPQLVNVANTPLPVQGTISVGNTPSVNVANPLTVSVSSMPPVQNFFTPVQVSGDCTYPAGSSTCTVNGVYTVPTGSTLVVTYYSGVCNGVIDDYATVAAQLSVPSANEGPLHTVTVPVTTGGTIIILNDWGQGLTFYGASGTSVTVQLFSAGPQATPVSCHYTVIGNLAPIPS